MKTARNLILGAAFLALPLLLAGAPQKCWPTSDQAVQQDQAVKRTLEKYNELGYTLVEDYEYRYRYIVPPLGDYLWGEHVYVFRSENKDPTAPAAYVTITAYIEYIPAEKGYRCSGLEVLEETFY